jgi:hypothetical protein
MGLVVIWSLSAYTAVRAARRPALGWYHLACALLVASIPVLGPLAYFIAFETPSRLSNGQRARPTQGAGPSTAAPGGYVWERTEEFDQVMPGVVPPSGRVLIIIIRCLVLSALLTVTIVTNTMIVGNGRARG